MTQYPQQPEQYPPPHGSYPYQPAPPKKHTARNVILVLLALSVLGIGGCVAFVGAVGNELAKDLETTAPPTGPGDSTTVPAPDDKRAPREVKIGQAFTLGRHRFDTGWKLQYQQYLGPRVVGQVTNVSQETSTAFFHLKFLKGSKVVANFQCSSSDLEPGQSEDLECINMSDANDDKLVYDKVTAEATF